MAGESVKLLVSVKDTHDFDRVVAALEQHMVVSRVLPTLRVVAGSVSRDAVSRVKALNGVEAVAEDHENEAL